MSTTTPISTIRLHPQEKTFTVRRKIYRMSSQRRTNINITKMILTKVFMDVRALNISIIQVIRAFVHLPLFDNGSYKICAKSVTQVPVVRDGEDQQVSLFAGLDRTDFFGSGDSGRGVDRSGGDGLGWC